jgi:outer membrane receptor protein involved in Fe transport
MRKSFFSQTINLQLFKALKGSIYAALCLFLLSGAAVAQTTVMGTVADKETNDPLLGINVIVKDKMVGTSTDSDGKFSLKTNLTPPFVLVISGIGFERQEVEVTKNEQVIDVRLAQSELLAKEVVVSATRVEDNITKSPISIEKMDIVTIRQLPTLNYLDALQNMKEVDMTTSSLGYKSINARGFNRPDNVRFVQLVDGVDMMAPSLNLSLGNFMGPVDMDVEAVEVIPGSASALYGNAALNGVMNVTTKSPFLYKGLSLQAKSGVNHLDGRDRDAAFFQEYSLRYATTIGDRFAVKVTGGLLRGQDWQANNFTNKKNNGLGDRTSRTDYDGLNAYGDELTITRVGGLDISRTGIQEKDLANYLVQNFKAAASLHYRLTNSAEINYGYKVGGGNTVFTGFQRYQLENFVQQQHRLEVKGTNFFVRGYASLENSGDSYDMGLTSMGINRLWKSDQQWASDYAANYATAIASGTLTVQQAHSFARDQADRVGGQLLVPGSDVFNNLKNQVKQSTINAILPNGAKGSKFAVDSRMYNVEGMYDLSKFTGKVVDIQVGGNYRLYDLNSKGTLFPDTTGNDITMYEYGVYTQLQKKLFQEKLKLIGSIRYDKSEQIKDGRFTPRISAVYTIKQKHNVRASFQTGFRMPTVQEQFIDLNLGYITLAGGLPEIYGRYGANSETNVYTLNSVRNDFGPALAAEVAGGTDQLQAIGNNLGRLRTYKFDRIKPEGVQTAELGYKGLFAEDRLVFDISGYYSIYKNFISARQVVVTPSQINIDPYGVGRDIANQNFRVIGVYDNAKEDVTAWGTSLGLTYNLPSGFTIAGNYTYADLDLGKQADELIAAFNTPNHKTNVVFGNRSLYKNVGFNIAWRWTDNYYWKSPYSEGLVPSMNNIDAQLTYKVSSINSLVRVGATNLFNNRYTQFYGGPQVGALYYVSITFDQFMR